MIRNLFNVTKLTMLLCMCLSFVFLTGCWSRLELSELSVVLAMGVDTVEEDMYEVSVQLVDPSQMSRNRTSERSPAITFSERASTIFEAVRKITTKTSRKMYFSHLRLLIFDEKTAKSGIKDSLDLLFRDHEVRPDFYIAVARKVSARDILGFVSPTEVLPAMDFDKSLTISEKAWAPTAAVNVVDMLQILMQDGKEPVLTGLTITGDLKKGQTMNNVKNPLAFGEYKYFGLGVFREERLVGWLNESDSKVYNYLTNKVKSTVAVDKCPGSNKKFVVEVTEAKAKITPSVQNNMPLIKVSLYIKGTINEIHCKINLKDNKSIKELEKISTETFKKLIEDGVQTVQHKYGVDIFGFGEAFHRKYPKHWQAWKYEWNEKFKQLPVEVSVKYELNKVGKMISPVDKEPGKEG